MRPFMFVLLLGVSRVLPADEPATSSLPDLVRSALDRNPEVQEARHRLETKRARVPQVGALPDPMLMYGVNNEGRPVPFQSLGQADFSEVYLGVSQDVPFPGKRGLREKVAADEVAAEEWTYEAVKRRVAADVADAYYEIYSVQAAQDILERNRRLAEQLVSVATTRYSVGQGAQHDVLEAEVEVSRLDEEATRLQQRRAVAEAMLDSLLPGALSAAVRPSPISTTPLPETLDQLLARAETESPLMREKERMSIQTETRVSLAQRERLPDLGFNFTYHNRGKLDPYYSFGGTVTLPLYAGRKQAKAVEEAASDHAAAQSALDAARAQVRYAVTQAFSMASTSDRLLHLYDEGILKQTRLALDSALSQYQVGKIDFLTLVASWKRLLEYELTYQEQLAEHEKAIARLSVHLNLTHTPQGDANDAR